MTNGEYIRSMNDAALAKFLDQLECATEMPWLIEFSEKFCGVVCLGEDYDCDHKPCKFMGQEVAWWLKQEWEDEE